jgi:hypothetical protein
MFGDSLRLRTGGPIDTAHEPITAEFLDPILPALAATIQPPEDPGQLRKSLISLSSADVDLRSLLPDFWIAAHLDHFLQYRRDEAEAAARARKRRREKRWDGSKARLPAG